MILLDGIDCRNICEISKLVSDTIDMQYTHIRLSVFTVLKIFTKLNPKLIHEYKVNGPDAFTGLKVAGLSVTVKK